MSDEEAGKQINDIGVIARVTPEHKVRLIEVLKRAGHVTSMTGDGVNDAPALKKADIGVAMGITGTDVSKEAAVMILTDDNFATIVKAVELGRALYDSLVKYIKFQMARLFGFILVFLGAALFNIVSGVPFLPLQTLWINFTIVAAACQQSQVTAASPVSYVDRNDPPMLLIVGSEDTLVPTKQTIEMAERLTAAGVKHDLIVLPGIDHSFIGKTAEATRDANLKALAATFEFIDRTIGNRSSTAR